MLLRGSVRRRHVYGAGWIAMLGVAVFARARRPPPVRLGTRVSAFSPAPRRNAGRTVIARDLGTLQDRGTASSELVGGVIYRHDAVAAQALVDVVTADDDQARCCSDATRLQ
jgi:hypothetical protein